MFVQQRLLLIEIILCRLKREVAVTDLKHLAVVVVLRFDIFKELLVLLDCGLLLLNSLFLRLEDLELLLLALDLSGADLVLFAQLGDVLVAVAHHFRVVVKEGGVLNQTLLQLVVFLAKLALFRLEFELLLREVLLLRDESLLIFVHLPAFVQETRGW